MLLSLCAGGVGASAPGPAGSSWRADPDDQFLLDVNIRQLRLGDGVRAYNTPEGTCVVLGDFLTTLDVPMQIDLTAKKASGWAFKENNRISIDYAAGAVTYAGKSEALAPGTIRETPEGWCVQTAALSRWFGIGVKPVTTGSVLVLQSDAKLPVEFAMERQQRAAHIHPPASTCRACPRCAFRTACGAPPRSISWSVPDMTYRASDGMRVDRQSSVFAAGEIAHLSYDAQITTTQKGKPSLLRLRAYRSDPDGGLLGPAPRDAFRDGRRRGIRQRPHWLGRRRARGGDHEPAARPRSGVRPHAFRGRFAERVGGRDLPQRGAARPSPRPIRASAMSLKMCSFSTARTRSRSFSTVRRARFGRARRSSMLARTMSPPERPGTGPGLTSPAATSSSWKSPGRRSSAQGAGRRFARARHRR